MANEVKPSSKLPWGHIIALIYGVSDGDERHFYIKGILENGWSRNVLSMQIENKSFCLRLNLLLLNVGYACFFDVCIEGVGG